MIDLPSSLELVGRLLVAALLGAVIGFERELRDHPAGLRTHLTVALGSALFAVVSAYAFQEFSDAGLPYRVDVTRVASNIVTGVGFLGGGTILKHGVTVRGLTTAASLWVTAAVGLAVGLGELVLAGATTLVLLLVLLGLRPVVAHLSKRWARNNFMLVVRMRPGVSGVEAVRAVHRVSGVELKSVRVTREDGDRRGVEAEVQGPPGATYEDVLAMFSDLDEVDAVEVV